VTRSHVLSSRQPSAQCRCEGYTLLGTSSDPEPATLSSESAHFPLGVAVREQLANVGQAEGAQQRVGDAVQQHVAVAVRDATPRVLHSPKQPLSDKGGSRPEADRMQLCCIGVGIVYASQRAEHRH